jgi:hypothetical protein
MATIADVLSSLEGISLTNDSDSIGGNAAIERRDVGLARLRALLTMSTRSDH